MKKHNIMKKLTALTLSLAMALALAACSSTGNSAGSSAASGGTSSGQSGSGASNSAGGEGYKIAVVRQLDHPSMNEIRDAITAELDAKADELGVSIEYRDFSGCNDRFSVTV